MRRCPTCGGRVIHSTKDEWVDVAARRFVATVPAHMVELSNSSQRDSAIVSSNSDGSKSISEIRFSGKKYALSLADNRASNSNSTESSKQ